MYVIMYNSKVLLRAQVQNIVTTGNCTSTQNETCEHQKHFACNDELKQ